MTRSAHRTKKLAQSSCCLRWFKHSKICTLYKAHGTLVILLLAISQAIYAQNESYRVRTSITSCLQVRSTASVEGQFIDCLPAGTLVRVVGSVPFWREITYGNDRRGWVAKKYIEPVENFREPADTTIPADAFLSIHFVDVGQGDAI